MKHKMKALLLPIKERTEKCPLLVYILWDLRVLDFQHCPAAGPVTASLNSR